MSSPQRYAIAWFVLLAMLAIWLQGDRAPIIQGLVLDADGPVANAHVGWQGRRLRAATDARGHFSLPLTAHTQRLVASKPGYRIASTVASAHHLTLRLDALSTVDNENYAWIDPHPDPKGVNNCANCHGDIYREWRHSAHARSATNAKFLHLFAGTDGKSPVQKTWNARAEHPDGSAVCATCHVPTLSSPTLDYDVREATGVARSGIHCDYCHKVADAPADKLGTRFGRDGLRLLRPVEGDLLSFGPLDDAVRPGESFAILPLYKESRYCASCHEGTVFGVHAYGTYSEWLESPAKQQGKQCQDCHMAPTGLMTNIAPGKGGIERDPQTLANHHTQGGQAEMLRRCLTLQVRTNAPGEIEIEVAAQNVGHRVPTGFPDRQVILVVEGFDATDKHVPLLDGPRLPASVGKWQGLPGRLYAKQLFGEGERTPTPFWLPILKTQDTRLIPEQPDRQTFQFPVNVRRVRVQLWYRRFWQDVADARGWTDNDSLIHENIWPSAKGGSQHEK
jgi:hypothetical protein